MIRPIRYGGGALCAPWWWHWSTLGALSFFMACCGLMWVLFVVTA